MVKKKCSAIHLIIVIVVSEFILFGLMLKLFIPLNDFVAEISIAEYIYIFENYIQARDVAKDYIYDKYGESATIIAWEPSMDNLVLGWRGDYLFEMEMDGEIFSTYVELSKYRTLYKKGDEYLAGDTREVEELEEDYEEYISNKLGNMKICTIEIRELGNERRVGEEFLDLDNEFNSKKFYSSPMYLYDKYDGKSCLDCNYEPRIYVAYIGDESEEKNVDWEQIQTDISYPIYIEFLNYKSKETWKNREDLTLEESVISNNLYRVEKNKIEVSNMKEVWNDPCYPVDTYINELFKGDSDEN